MRGRIESLEALVTGASGVDDLTTRLADVEKGTVRMRTATRRLGRAERKVKRTVKQTAGSVLRAIHSRQN